MSNADRCARKDCQGLRMVHDKHTHPFVEPAPRPAPSGDEAKVRAIVDKWTSVTWGRSLGRRGAVIAIVREAYAAGLRDAALLVEFADLFWSSGDPRTRIATELRKRAADAIARRGSEGT